MTKLIVIVGFVVAFSAGLMVGMSARRHAEESPGATTRPSGPGGPGGRGSWLAQELNLTPEQQDALKKIWDDPDRKGREEHEDARRKLRRERDEAIAALVQDRSTYDQIMHRYEQKTDALDAAMRKGFEEKVRLTKEQLTDDQKSKYDEMLKRRSRDFGRDGGGRDGGGRDGGGRDGGRDHETTRRSGSGGATTRPSQP